MALVFRRRLTIPLWVTAFLALALTTPQPPMLFLMLPATLFAIAVAGILIVFTMPGAIPWLRTSRSLARAPSTRRRALAEPNRRTADDALDCARMDDDGGWQMARPPA